MLAERFGTLVHSLGMKQLEHPLFYHAPVALRFEIGGDEPVYSGKKAGLLIPNPTYVEKALERATAIYRYLPAPPEILRIDGCLDEKSIKALLSTIRERTGLSEPQEQIIAAKMDDDEDSPAQAQFYWNLNETSFDSQRLLHEIILGDIGGWSGFVSSVYLAGQGAYLYHLYDDRGLDLLGGSSKLLQPLYHQFHDWILAYNLEQIDSQFALQ